MIIKMKTIAPTTISRFDKMIPMLIARYIFVILLGPFLPVLKMQNMVRHPSF